MKRLDVADRGCPGTGDKRGPSMTTNIRGCPRCRHSVRARVSVCPHCGALLRIKAVLTVLGVEEEITVEAPEPEDD